MRRFTSFGLAACGGLALAVGAHGQGSNSCGSAQSISGFNTFFFDNSAATTDGLSNAACNQFSQNQINNDVWFSWTAPETTTVTLSTCGCTTVDTKVAVYLGASPCAFFPVIIDCNDDTCGLQSVISWSATSGTNYRIRVGTFPGASGGTGYFAIQRSGAPSNDLFDDAITVSVPSVTAGTTVNANTDSNAPFCGTTVSSPGVWYRVVGIGGTMSASTCSGTAYDSKISIFTGDCDSLVCVTGNDDTCGLQSQVTWASTNGTTYWILVHGFGGASGAFSLSVTGAPNDECVTPTAISALRTYAFDNTLATTGAQIGCFMNNDLWYNWTSPVTGNVTVRTCGLAAFDTEIGIFNGCSGPAVVCNDDFCGLQSGLTFSAVSGTAYRIQIGSFSGGSSGPGYFAITGPTSPPSDLCYQAIPVSIPSVTAGTTVGANIDDDGGPFCGTNVNSPGVWYTVVGNGSPVTADTCNGATSYDSKISVYTGSCGQLVCVGGNDDTCGLQSSVTWSSVNGVTYHILVHGFGGSSGAFQLRVTSPVCRQSLPCPPNVDNMGLVNSGDFFTFIPAFLAGNPANPIADYDCNGVVNSGDFFLFIPQFLNPGQFPGCP